MARDRQTEQTRNQGTQSNTPTTRSAETTSSQTSERQRNIDTAQERGSSGGLTRPYSGPVRGGMGGGQLSSPFSLMRRMAEDIDRLFDSFGLAGGLGVRSGGYDDLWSSPAFQGGALWSPQVELFERDNKLVVRADVPGVNKDDVNIEVNDGVLTISGERKEEREENREGFYRSERSYGQFYRAIPLPEGANPDQAEATFKDGVLEIAFDKPRQQEKKGRKIQVR